MQQRFSCAFFFVVLMAFFLDYKLVALVSLEIGGSLAVVWIMKASNPAQSTKTSLDEVEKADETAMLTAI